MGSPGASLFAIQVSSNIPASMKRVLTAFAYSEDLGSAAHPCSLTRVFPVLSHNLEKRPRDRAVSAPDFGSRGRGFESR